MPLKRWDHGACITYGRALPGLKVAIPAALVTAYIAGSSLQSPNRHPGISRP